MPKYLVIVCIFNIFFSTASYATNCKSKDYQSFDFWLGEWKVSSKNSTNVSHNKISKINDGCGLLEEYTTPTGFKGKSLNIFNKQDGLWHQTWVDNSGLLLQLKGQLQSNSMIMQGYSIDKSGNRLLNQISWQPLESGDVRQHWQVSKDGGKNWQTVFDGLYQKVTK